MTILIPPSPAENTAEKQQPAPSDSLPLAHAEEPAEASAVPTPSTIPTPSPADQSAALSAAPLPASAEMNAQKPGGRPFEPGQSGNPLGRPKGSRNRVTQAVEALIHGQAEALGAKAVEKALKGDASMLRALLSTLMPTRRERTVEFELPKLEITADAVKASSAVISACAAGELSPNEASEIMGLISTHVRTIEAAELEQRIAALEKKQEQKK